MTDTPLEQIAPETASTAAGEVADAIAEVADQPRSLQRVGLVTAVETGGSRRVQVDIAGTTWLSRVQDSVIAVGDRVSILQQDEVMLVIGRLSGGVDAFPPIGTIMPYAGATAPNANWALANGAALSRTTYAALYAVCGTTYGSGDGSTTFNIPNIGGRMPIGTNGTYARGATGGSATTTLSSSHLPSHTHSFSDTASTDSQGSHTHSTSGSSTSSDGGHTHSVGNQGARSDICSGCGTTTAATGGGSTGSAGGHSHTVSVSVNSGGGHTHSVTVSGTTGSAGSGSSVTTISPYLGLSYIIRVL